MVARRPVRVPRAGPRNIRWWNHAHRFESVSGGTRVIDDVEYVPRARWISGALVRRDVARIFTYRQQTLASLFTR
ncbi:MAG: hypothetical protein M3Q55_02550 [Acidobacteriota bacterium]|nr:hypothetical protein [Acidobacteriota bacterium]